MPRVCGGPGCAACNATVFECRRGSLYVAVEGSTVDRSLQGSQGSRQAFHGGEMRAEGTEICSTVGDLLALSGERSCIQIHINLFCVVSVIDVCGCLSIGGRPREGGIYGVIWN